MAIIIYRNGEQPKDPWIKYFCTRTNNNKNNLVAIIGPTGSGKTYAGLSICQMISKENGIPFEIENVVFNLKELFSLINSGKLSKGSSIVFDEPQCSISSREWQGEYNKVFNYLLSTFRHRCINLFFCTPYEDLLDLSSRKLFHAKIQTAGINTNTKMCRLRPKTTEYNSQLKKFYEKWLRVSYRPINSNRNITKKYEYWNVPKPSEELINLYEAKKYAFTSKLNQDIERRLDSYQAKEEIKINKNLKDKKPLTPRQQQIYDLFQQGRITQKEISERLNLKLRVVNENIGWMKNKGWDIPDNRIVAHIKTEKPIINPPQAP